MKPVVTLLLASLLVLAGCQSSPEKSPANEPDNASQPESSGSQAPNTVLLSAHHCLSEYLREQGRVHYGPCLKIISVNDTTPQVRDDGFITLPVATAVILGTSCVYRHADGSPIPATMETTDFLVTPQTFTEPGKRWYLHAQTQASQVIGCEPTLSRSKKPTYRTD
ncbi:hypothetical protein [Marinobacter antarcticus]|uniref:Lipoprotein n=2 Tax=root TaxID=1 RepID=A0A831R2T2_9GAMM|nr:hypothetical protein [Marinobacter antarcticus]HEA51160.1 hypothetical protein [Marinobacter antarcticus]